MSALSMVQRTSNLPPPCQGLWGSFGSQSIQIIFSALSTMILQQSASLFPHVPLPWGDCLGKVGQFFHFGITFFVFVFCCLIPWPLDSTKIGKSFPTRPPPLGRLFGQSRPFANFGGPFLYCLTSASFTLLFRNAVLRAGSSISFCAQSAQILMHSVWRALSQSIRFDDCSDLPDRCPRGFATIHFQAPPAPAPHLPAILHQLAHHPPPMLMTVSRTHVALNASGILFDFFIDHRLQLVPIELLCFIPLFHLR